MVVALLAMILLKCNNSAKAAITPPPLPQVGDVEIVDLVDCETGWVVCDSVQDSQMVPPTGPQVLQRHCVRRRAHLPHFVLRFGLCCPSVWLFGACGGPSCERGRDRAGASRQPLNTGLVTSHGTFLEEFI